MKKFVVLIVMLGMYFGAAAQTYGLAGRRASVSLNVGMAPNGFDIYEYSFYSRRNEEFKVKRSFLAVPVELGFQYVLLNRLSAFAGFGMHKQYSRIESGPGSQTIIYPFRTTDLSFGIQINGSNYYAPVSRMYGEIGVVHSMISSVDSVFNGEMVKASFGTLTFGIYQNLFFNKSKSFMLFFGARFGLPIYATAREGFEEEGYGGFFDSTGNFGELRQKNSLMHAVQIKVGGRYILPF